MRRILILSLAYHPFVGGAEVAVKEITDRLPSSKYQFDLVTLRFDRSLPKKELLGNVTIHRLGPSVLSPAVSERKLPLQLHIAKLLYPFTAAVFASKLHRDRKYDAVWAIMQYHAGIAALFFKYMHPTIPLVLELQDGRSTAQLQSTVRTRVVWPLIKHVYKKADAMKVISNFLAYDVKKFNARAPIFVIPNGVDVKKFSAPEDVEEIRKRLRTSPEDIVLFTASRLVFSRGIEDVIRALPLMPRNVRFAIAGSGDDEEALRDLSHSLGVEEKVIFLGQLSHDELPKYLHASDIFVRPSRWEGMGNSFVEAMAAGAPIIGTPVGGIPDFLFDPGQYPQKPTGLFCAVGDPASIASAVNRYLTDDALRRSIIKNARELSKTYDWERIAADVDSKVFSPLRV